MFEEESPTPTVKPTQEAKKAERARMKIMWKEMSVEELIHHMDEIRKALPPTALAEVNLEEELMLQFQAVRALQSQVLADDEQPLNQRAQVANSVQTVLSKLIEMQDKVYSTERYKAFEQIMIRHLSKLPEDVAQAFLEDYEKAVLAVK